MISTHKHLAQHPHEARPSEASRLSSRTMPRHARNSAFSLMEVLVALGIFTVGLVAVAAIFPTAITIQRDTVREVDGRRVGKNARAVVLAASRTVAAFPGDDNKPYAEISYNPSTRVGSLAKFIEDAENVALTAPDNNTPVMPMIDLPENPAFILGTATGAYLDAPTSFNGLFNLETRSYPKNIADYYHRDYYWYPLIQVSGNLNPRWTMLLVVMHRDGTNQPPEIRRSIGVTASGTRITFNNGLFADGTDNDNDDDGIPDYIQAGDKIIGDDGLIHSVIIAEKNSVVVNSDNVGNLQTFYFGVAIDAAGNIKLEGRTPIVWVEDGIILSVND